MMRRFANIGDATRDEIFRDAVFGFGYEVV